MNSKGLYFEVLVGSSSCLAITDGDGTGTRVLGDKQWGVGKTRHLWEVGEQSAKDIVKILSEAYPNILSDSI